LTAPLSLRLSRCAYFLFVETDSGQTEARPNPGLKRLEEAGLQAARFVVEHGAEAVMAVMIGRHAQQVLEEAGVSVYEAELPSGRQVVERLRSGRLQVRSDPFDRDQE